jgi:RNA polymerase sigma-70 factor (ECF subfamily)
MAEKLPVTNINRELIPYRNGDKLAERRIYKYLYTRLIGNCLRYANDQQDAWDIFNRAMLDVFKVLKKGEKIENLEAYSRVVVVRKCIDYARQRNRLRKYHESFEIDNPFTVNAALNRLEAEDITNLIAELPLSQRSVFNMYVIEGFSHKEIAKELNIPEGSSKWYLSEAKKKLRERLKALYD